MTGKRAFLGVGDHFFSAVSLLLIKSACNSNGTARLHLGMEFKKIKSTQINTLSVLLTRI